MEAHCTVKLKQTKIRDFINDKRVFKTVGIPMASVQLSCIFFDIKLHFFDVVIDLIIRNV